MKIWEQWKAKAEKAEAKAQSMTARAVAAEEENKRLKSRLDRLETATLDRKQSAMVCKATVLKDLATISELLTKAQTAISASGVTRKD